MRRLPVLSLLIAALVSLAATTGARAFTLMRDVWASTNTTYGMDTSFTNRGAAWVNRANEAAQHWADLTAFDFFFNSVSGNRLRTGNLDCNTLANMTPVEGALGIYRTSFVITVNVNAGCPMVGPVVKTKK